MDIRLDRPGTDTRVILERKQVTVKRHQSTGVAHRKNQFDIILQRHIFRQAARKHHDIPRMQAAADKRHERIEHHIRQRRTLPVDLDRLPFGAQGQVFAHRAFRRHQLIMQAVRFQE